MKRQLRQLALTVFAFLVVPAAAHAAPLKVVTTTTLFAEIVRRVGGERVEVKPVASPKFNIHFIQPRPSDVRSVAKADLFVFTGLDLEAWADPLLEAAGKPELFRGGARCLDLSQGVRLLKVPTGALSRSEGDLHLFGNPHYQLDPRNAGIAARAVGEKLAELDPAGAEEHRSRAEALGRELDAKIAEWKGLCAHCAGKEIISFHDDIAYLADFLGLKADQFLEPKPGVPPTPRHLAFLEEYASRHGVRAIATATYYDRGPAQAFAKRLGAELVPVGQNPGEIPGTEDLFAFYETNVKAIAEALK